MTEHAEQAALFNWAQLQENYQPVLRLLNSSQNGMMCSKQQAAKAKKAGMKRGIPDINFPVSRGGYHGLFIELKKIGGRVSPEQKIWLSDLRDQGYMAVVCYGFDEARQTIEEYLEMA
jgi:hypothetical protein